MLCAVVSSARWWAVRPRSAVWSPKKAEMPVIALGLEVERPQPGGLRRGGRGDWRAGLGGRAVAGLGRGAHEAREVVEEGKLLAHERAVDAVLAGDLAQQAAQLGAALPGGGPVGGRQQRGQRLQRDGVRGQA